MKSLGLALPKALVPIWTYLPCRQAGNLLYLSGQGPKLTGTVRTGRLGHRHYDRTGLRGRASDPFAVAKEALGELSRIEAVVKVFGMVNAEPDFPDHPKVINGCSDLLVEVLGEAGRHARSAVGMGSLPNGMTVEIEAILMVRS